MKIYKMREKIEKVFEDNKNRLFAVYNRDSLGLFCVNSYMYYRIPEIHILTANLDAIRRGEALCRMDARAPRPSDARDPVNGDLITFGSLPGKKNIIRLFNGDNYVYIDRKFTRTFPKNTVYFSKGAKDPVTAALIEGETVYAFAVIMPIRVFNDSDFTVMK